MIATVVNAVVVVLGGLLGLLLAGRLKEEYTHTIVNALGICVIVIGITSAITTSNILIVIICLVIGTILGELLKIESRLDSLGDWLKAKVSKNGGGRFTEGFVTASLTVCIGAMAIVGAIEDGIFGDFSILATKAVLDFIIILVMTGSMGKGCVFSAIPVGILQGSVTMLAKFIKPIMTEPALSNLSMIGSILIFCVGLNLVWGKKIRVANLLPAIVLAVAVAFLPFDL